VTRTLAFESSGATLFPDGAYVEKNQAKIEAELTG
jgi:hypothetical protein